MQMAVSVSSFGKLNPEVQLAQAISEYESVLSSDEKALLRNLKAKDLPDAVDVVRFTTEIDQLSKINRRYVGTRFTNVLYAIQTFASIGDVIVGGSQNLIASGLWALVRFTLQAATNHASFLDRFSHLFMDIGRSAPRYQNLALVYPRSSILQSNICEYFTILVRLCTKAVNFTRKNALNRLLVTSLRSFDSEFGDFLQKFENLGKVIKEEVIFLSAKTQQDEARENSKFRSILINKLDRNYESRHRLAFKLSLLDRCSVYDYGTSWRQARKKGTYPIYNTTEYLEWRENKNVNPTLICLGKLGSGKTVLAANLLEDLILNASKGTVAYFFCRHDNVESLKARTIIGSLIRQLLEFIGVEDLLDLIVQPTQTHKNLFDLDELVSLFHRHVLEKLKIKSIYLVIDGLDDCEESERKCTFQYLQSLAQNGTVKFFLTTRSELERTFTLVKNHLPESSKFQISHQTDEINDYINDELNRQLESGALCLSNPEIIVEIQNTLKENAQGMFLWVVLQIESICDEETDDAILDALKDLPTNLPAVYDRILRKSSRLNSAKKILQLVLSAYRPLSIWELREALSVVPGDNNLDPKKFVNDIYKTISCCGSLLELSEETLTVHFIHPSAKQHLLSSGVESTADTDTSTRFSYIEANRLMGGICITYLSWSGFETRLTTQHKPWSVSGSETISTVAISPLQSTTFAKKVAQLYLKRTRKSSSSDSTSFDFKKALMETYSEGTGREFPMEFFFLSYAKEYWLDHGREINENMGEVWILWQKLISDPPSIADKFPWGNSSDASSYDTPAERMKWAIACRHQALTFAILKTDRGGCLRLIEETEETALKHQLQGDWSTAAKIRQDIVESLALGYSAASLDVLISMWNLALSYQAMDGMKDSLDLLLTDFLLKLKIKNGPFITSVLDSSIAFQTMRNNTRYAKIAQQLLELTFSLSQEVLGAGNFTTVQLSYDIESFEERHAKNLVL